MCTNQVHYHQRVHTKGIPVRAGNAENVFSVALTFIVMILHTAKFMAAGNVGNFVLSVTLVILRDFT